MADRCWVQVVMTEESSELPRISRWGLAGFRARERELPGYKLDRYRGTLGTCPQHQHHSHQVNKGTKHKRQCLDLTNLCPTN